MKGVGSIRRAILRGGLRFRGGTTISSEAAEAKRFESCLLGVEKKKNHNAGNKYFSTFK